MIPPVCCGQKIIVEEGGYNLAAGGAVGRNALDEEEVALELLDYLRRHYLALLQERYQADKDQVAIGTILLGWSGLPKNAGRF